MKRRLAQGTLAVRAAPTGTVGEASQGTLTFIDNAVDATTGTITLKATFPNRDRRLWPGQFADVSLVLALEKGAVVAPASAVQKGQQGTYVYVLQGDDTVDARPVSVERTWQNVAVVTKGLAKGDRVVTDGQLRLSPGAKVAVKTEGARS